MLNDPYLRLSRGGLECEKQKPVVNFVDIMDTKMVEEVSDWLQEKGVSVEHCNSFEGMLRSLSSFANCHLVSLTSQTLSILYRLTGEGKVCTSALACVIPFLHILEERIKCVYL